MTSQTKCLKCGDALLETAQLDHSGNRALDAAKEHLPLEHYPDTGQTFIKCPHCGAKNGFREVSDDSGGPTQFALERLLK